MSVSAHGSSVSKPLTITLDPRATEVNPADLVAQRDAALALRELSGRVAGFVDRTNDLIRQLTNLTEALRRNAPNAREAMTEAETALRELRTLRDEKLQRPLQGLGYRQFPRLREEVQSLYGAVSRSLFKPTDAQVLRQGELLNETQQLAQELNAIITGRITRVNTLLKDTPHVLIAGQIVM